MQHLIGFSSILDFPFSSWWCLPFVPASLHSDISINLNASASKPGSRLQTLSSQYLQLLFASKFKIRTFVHCLYLCATQCRFLRYSNVRCEIQELSSIKTKDSSQSIRAEKIQILKSVKQFSECKFYDPTKQCECKISKERRIRLVQL